MKEEEKKLADHIIGILQPLCDEWGDATGLINSIEKGLFKEDELVKLAQLLLRATQSVEQDERIGVLEYMSEMIRNNRKKENIEHDIEKKESENIINCL